MNEPYNKAAIAIMEKNGIEINDLYSVIAAEGRRALKAVKAREAKRNTPE